jgi:hypothetical protein
MASFWTKRDSRMCVLLLGRALPDLDIRAYLAKYDPTPTPPNFLALSDSADIGQTICT